MTRGMRTFERLVASAQARYDCGELGPAAAEYRAALVLMPSHPRVLHNLGVILAKQRDAAAALECFGAALAADSHYASAHYHRGVVLESIGRRPEAIDAFQHAVICAPDHYAAHRSLAFNLLAEGRRGPALDHFARLYELRRGEDRSDIALSSLTCSNRTKLRHDAAQFRYLASLGRERERFTALAMHYERIGRDFPTQSQRLSRAELEQLGEGYNTALYLADAPEIAGPALGPRPDAAELVKQFSAGPGVLYCDDLLSPRALLLLRRYLLQSTIWHDFSHIEGFVAAYLEDGLAHPLLLQIADELRKAFPELLSPHPLSQAWAFKAVDPHGAIEAHADDALVSVNFWVTPTGANRDPNRGGLTVCLTPPPADLAPVDYQSRRADAVHFLEQNSQNRLVVPYRENRSVMFDSRLVHASDEPAFSGGYENHRISVTLLFGTRRAGAAPMLTSQVGGPQDER